MEPLRVLVVDDSLITVKKLAGMLTTLGHKVAMTAATGKEALSAYKSCNPDLVTMDITMPDMDGIEATREIRKLFPAARIIMVTSHGQEAMVLDALKAGARGYVIKPFEKDKLEAAIRNAMKLSVRQDKLQEVIEKKTSAQEEPAQEPAEPSEETNGSTQDGDGEAS